MKKIIIYLSVVTMFLACNPLENEMEGLWVVDQAYYNNEPVIWDLYSNVFLLESNNTCKLPISDLKYRHTDKRKGIWSFYEKNDTYFLKIKTKNEIFNRTFEIQDLKKEKDSVHLGYFLKITLVADSLKMNCKKVLHSR